MKYLLLNLAELAERRARNVREEAQLWDILSRDLKRAAKGAPEDDIAPTPKRPAAHNEAQEISGDRICVRVKEAQKIMGMSRSSLYTEISEGRLPIRKSGRTTLIAMTDIHDWFDRLPQVNKR